jgi:hypothetical protein
MYFFLVWSALLLTPLFSEVGFFGMTFKRDFESFKKQVEQQLIAFDARISNSVAVSPHFNLAVPPSDSSLPEIKRHIEETIRQYLGNSQVEPRSALEAADMLNLDADTKLLANVRVALERAVRRIARNSGLMSGRLFFLNRILDDLVLRGVLNRNITSSIKDVYAVCSLAVHGEKPSAQQVEFVRATGPTLVYLLRKIHVLSSPSEEANEGRP